MKKITVLIVDDSILIRKMLKEIFDQTDDIEVVGVASDPIIAREKIKALNPDVLTLDVEMPKMDGLQFLSNLMRLRPMPVVMVSTLTEKGAPETLEALTMGAVDYICKPKAQTEQALKDFSADLCDKIRVAKHAKILAGQGKRSGLKRVVTQAQDDRYKRVVCIGSSTGGTEAIDQLVSNLPLNCPPIVIVQHIPPVFSESFSKRLNNRYPMEVVEAQNNLEVKKGRIIIAQGGKHLRFTKQQGKLVTLVEEGEKVNRHCPSVSVMFDSLREVLGSHKIVSVMLTGMGEDGAESMKHQRSQGAVTIAQDEATSVVWGMPKAAYKLGAVDSLLPLDKIADQLIRFALRA